MTYLKLYNISKKFERAAMYTIQNLNFEIEQGELVTLLGKSGCGKTTVLRLIAGFETPTTGEIILNDKMISCKDSWLAPEKRNIGMVFQDYALFPNMTAEQNIGFGIATAKDYHLQVTKMLKLVNLYEYKNKYPHQLSGGQQQRVALARALIRKPEIVLLDEPFSNLDKELKENMREEVIKILNETGSTALFVTHDQTEAMTVSQRIAVLEHGTIQQIASPLEIYTKPVNLFVAEFMGNINLFTGSVRSKSEVMTELGPLSCKEPILQKPGTRVKFFVRPEDIAIDTNGHLTGTVLRAICQGIFTKIIFKLMKRELPIQIIMAGQHQFQSGENLKLNILIQRKEHIFSE